MYGRVWPIFAGTVLAVVCSTASALAQERTVGLAPATGIAQVPAAASRFEPVIQGNAAPKDNAGLFVGVNEFEDPDLQSLNYAVDDAIATAYLFVTDLRLIPPTNCWLALKGSPHGATAQKQLSVLLDAGVISVEAKLVPLDDAMKKVCGSSKSADGLLVVWISSHGFDEESRSYVMPFDARRRRLSRFAWAVDDILSDIRSSQAGKSLLLVDACRTNNVGGQRGPGEQPNHDALFSTLSRQVPNGCAVLASCSNGQVSYEDKTLEHGVFTHHLLAALRGGAAPDDRGYITVGPVSECVREGVARWALNNRPGGVPQEPWTRGAEALKMPLAVDREARKEAILREFREEATRTVDRLKLRIDTKGPFDAELFTRAAKWAEQVQKDSEAEEILAQMRRFAEDGSNPSLYAAYLQTKLPRLPASPAPPAPPTSQPAPAPPPAPATAPVPTTAPITIQVQHVEPIQSLAANSQAADALRAEWSSRGYVDQGARPELSAIWGPLRDRVLDQLNLDSSQTDQVRKYLELTRQELQNTHLDLDNLNQQRLLAYPSIPPIRDAIAQECKDVNTANAAKRLTNVSHLIALAGRCVVAEETLAAPGDLATLEKGFPDLYRKVKDSAAEAPEGVAGNLLARLELVNQVLNARTRDDLGKLFPDDRVPSREVAMVAWKKLDHASIGWPTKDMDTALLLDLGVLAATRAPGAQDAEPLWPDYLKHLLATDAVKPETALQVSRFVERNRDKLMPASATLPKWIAFNIGLAKLLEVDKPDDKGLIAQVRALAEEHGVELSTRLPSANADDTWFAGPDNMLKETRKAGGARQFYFPGFEVTDTGSPPLVFVGIPSDNPVFYISATEVSLRTVMKALGMKERHAVFGTLMPKSNPPRLPHVWRWNNDKLEADPDGLGRTAFRPPPSTRVDVREYPMQYITPQAAVYAAFLLDCRLPTSHEWDEAQKQQRQNNPDAPVKLRSKAWMSHWSTASPYDIGEGAFHWYATGKADNSKAWEKPPFGTLDQDPCVVFHTAAQRGTGLADLVGNVAEYVIDSPVPKTLLNRVDTSGGTEAQALRNFVRTARAGVVGGSAFSPPDLWDDVRWLGEGDYDSGFCDVGFRLVFGGSAGQSMDVYAQQLRKDPPYQLPKRPLGGVGQ